MRRATLVLAALCAFALPTTVPILEAQQRPDTTLGATPRTERRFPRRVLFSVIGASLVTLAASAYLLVEDRESPQGNCTSRTCVTIVSVGGGGLVGYMIGREFDQLHALRYRGGAPLNPSTVSTPLAGEPLLLTVQDSIVAVAGGPGGVQLFASGPSAVRASGRRATGIRGVEAIALTPGQHALAVGAPTGLYLYPPATGPGVLVREGRTTAATAVGDRIFFAVGSRIESAPATADTARTWPGIDVGRRVDMLAADPARGLLWAVTDSVIVSLRPVGDSLEQVGSLALDGPARRLAVQGNRVAVALGQAGVRLLDASDPAAPREVASWTNARYVYDVSFAGPRLYAAAGVEGVYVLLTDGDRLTTAGLARELGFATALESRGGYTYVIDRTSNSLRRFRSDF